jgi:hypothetical protein
MANATTGITPLGRRTLATEGTQEHPAPTTQNPSAVFTLDGHRVSTMRRGLNVIRLNDDTVYKVIY